MRRDVADTYPQPVAQAAGRVARSLTATSRLDAVLRCAETAARYLAALGIASYAARDEDADPPAAFGAFRGNLSFGHYLDVAKATARLKVRHPLQSAFSAALLSKKSPAETNLGVLLELRNKLGHQLQGVGEDRAERVLAGLEPALLAGRKPEAMLGDALDAVRPVCELPLFYLDSVEWASPAFRASGSLVMGEGEPTPQTFPVQSAPPFPETKRLYVGTYGGLLSVHPKLVWDYQAARSTRSVFLLHSVGESALGYDAVVEGGEPHTPPAPDDLVGMLRGTVRQPAVALPLGDGRRLDEVWAERRESLLSGAAGAVRPVDWSALDGPTLAWYARLLASRLSTTGAPAEAVRVALLDGRGDVTPDEHRQLQLLFGTPQTVRQLLGRPVVDLRARAGEEGRWDVRDEVEANVITALQRAVRFVAANNDDVDGALAAEGLDATVGSADYVAVREALVNLLVHQDYGDQRLAGQIELVPHRTTLINPGHSLVPTSELFEGGNASRNPLIARALKLIGFAELAGSGLRELARAWRQAGRRAPDVDSDAAAGRFRITLDSQEVESMTDAFWKGKSGVEVTPAEARILGVLGQAPSGLTPEAAAERTGMDADETVQALARLVVQQVVHDHGGTYALKDQFVALAQQAGAS